MATKTQSAPGSFSRLRLGLGFAHKPRPKPLEEPEEDDWYTPYNGPYEIPSEVAPRQDRDSWGQLLTAVVTNELVGGDGEGSEGGMSSKAERFRSRTLSDVNTVRVNPTSARSPRMPVRPMHIGTSHSPMLVAGGVGESPMPIQRFQDPPPPPSHRLSLASFLTFGSVSKRLSSAPPSRSSRPTSPAAPVRRGSGKRRQTEAGTDGLQSNAVAQDELFDSYYSTLVSTPKIEPSRLRVDNLEPLPPRNATSPSPYSSPTSPHPYAYPFPSSQAATSPRRAPPVAPSSYKGKGVDRSQAYPSPPPNPQAKSSVRSSLLKAISTPNLRALARNNGASPGPAPRSAKQRWLSPETWCDALLFPRPRFTVRIEGDAPARSLSARVLSPASAWPGEARSGPVVKERPSIDATASLSRGLAKAKSAINLSAVAGPSSGPPVAEPMLLRPTHGRERPQSFAQDDLALPSPVPSLAKVLEANATLDRERQAWKSQASRSFQNKRTRSFGRGRSKSVGHRVRLKEPGSIDFLAARTLLGSQAVAPTVHMAGPFAAIDSSAHTKSLFGTLSSHSHTKSHAHSNSLGQSTSDGHVRGHSRTNSGVKSALRTAAGFCINDDQISPKDEPKAFSVPLHQQGTKIVHLQDQMYQEKYATDQPRVISPASAALAQVRRDHLTGPSPSPSGITTSGEGAQVGIAISSPPPPPSDDHSDLDQEPLSLPDHPYAQRGFSAPYQPHHRHQHSDSTQYRGSDYAGPHPSTPAIAVPPETLVNDVSARHRLPPHAVLHPYATVYSPLAHEGMKALPDSPPYMAVPLEVSSPVRRHGGMLPPTQMKVGDAQPTHAYAAGDRYSGGPLGLGDAMSLMLRRRGSADSGLGDSEDHTGNHEAQADPVNPHSLVTPRREQRPNFLHSTTQHSSQTNHTVASSPPDTLNPPFFRASTTGQHAAGGSPSEPSSTSSVQQSPRPFSSLEDLDRYRDLFYKPDSRTPSSEHQRRLAPQEPVGNIPMDVASRSSHAGSGLMNLTRQLSEELEALQDERGMSQDYGDSSQMWGRRYGGLRGPRSQDSRTDPNVILSTSSLLDSPEDATTLPLRLHRGPASPQTVDPPAINVPEDIESSRASSIMERSELEDVDHDQLLRLGTVEAVSTPAAMSTDQRFSGHLSLIGEVGSRRSSEEGGLPTEDSTITVRPRVISTTSLSAPRSAYTELTRSSYITNGTDTSRMSGLSEFPAPPQQFVVSADRASIFHSYFGDTQRSQTEDPPAAGVRPRPPMLLIDSSHRMTFGDQSDISEYSDA
ncbi:hypothetical protein BV25DRAFT_1899064 [Artomyces pyxidatus]|uniref:Uncharacterized protein n=1 Tax=Artomyces pyxidatus TaxID=48021 RepID=A0ACB8T564_9AGAM|nr:hypothetical protein BV25DRAFT_1899064 [Artomyces pyxidatus]